MTGFDFIFALFSLLLGLAMAEVFGGFAQVMKLHARARAGLGADVRVGWLVPLTALFVLLGQLAFWTQTFTIRDQVPFNYLTLLIVTTMVGSYYLLSVLVWPENLSEWPDFDRYYDQHKRMILTGNLVLTIAAGVIGALYAPPITAAQRVARQSDAALVGVMLLFVALMANVVLIFVRGRRLNVGLLTLLVTMQVGGSIAAVNSGLNSS